MRYFSKYVCLAVFLLSVVSCGGGGGGGGTPNGPSATLRTYPPIESIAVPVGFKGSSGIEVRGGKGPYGVITSDASIQP